jgi:peptide/nickel transport system ATP-binding protein/oligopeptide transport system ATP-binding protein
MNVPLLSADSLVKHFVVRRSLMGHPLAVVRAVDGVSFSVASGETLALVGESGCGKSTVGRLILRLVDPTSGSVSFDGNDVLALSTGEMRVLRSRAQLIFQDPYASLNPRMTVGEMLNEPLLLHTSLNKTERHAKVGEILGLVGLRRDHADRYPHEFSGGQRQRIAIARALAAEPKLIVCDEPVSALDVSIRSQVLNLLKELQQKLGLAYVFISHDLAVVKHIADRIAVMYLGRIVETGDADAVFSEPRHPYTQALLSAIPVPSVARGRRRQLLPGDPPSPIAPPPGCHLHTRCPYAADICRTDSPALIDDGTRHGTACHRWRDVQQSTGHLAMDGEISPHLRKLIEAFEKRA